MRVHIRSMCDSVYICSMFVYSMCVYIYGMCGHEVHVYVVSTICVY